MTEKDNKPPVSAAFEGLQPSFDGKEWMRLIDGARSACRDGGGLIKIVDAIALYVSVSKPENPESAFFRLLLAVASDIAAEEFVETFDPATRISRTAFSLMAQHADDPAERFAKLWEAPPGLELVDPLMFGEWLEEMGLPYFREYVAEVEMLSRVADNAPLKTRERDTLLRLILGMAIRGYGHDPSARKTETVSQITKDLEHLGIPVSDETIRKYLKEAAGLLPGKPPKT
jgi:hypothetical protein